MNIERILVNKVLHNNIVIEQDLDNSEQFFLKIQRMDDKQFYVKIRNIEIEDVIDALQAYKNILQGDFENE